MNGIQREKIIMIQVQITNFNGSVDIVVGDETIDITVDKDPTKNTKIKNPFSSNMALDDLDDLVDKAIKNLIVEEKKRIRNYSFNKTHINNFTF